jgi:hypothetical protein
VHGEALGLPRASRDLTLPRWPSPGPFLDESSQSSTSREDILNTPLVRTPDEHPQYQVAEALIKRHNLKLTKKDARRLEEYLLQPRRQYDLDKIKHLLCQELGPVDGNRKFDPGDRDLGFVYAPLKEIEDRDRKEHTGNTARTANATQIRNTSMEMNLRWARLGGIEGGVKSENLVDRQIGNLFTGLFAFDDLQETAYVIVGLSKGLENTDSVTI